MWLPAVLVLSATLGIPRHHSHHEVADKERLATGHVTHHTPHPHLVSHRRSSYFEEMPVEELKCEAMHGISKDQTCEAYSSGDYIVEEVGEYCGFISSNGAGLVGFVFFATGSEHCGVVVRLRANGEDHRDYPYRYAFLDYSGIPRPDGTFASCIRCRGWTEHTQLGANLARFRETDRTVYGATFGAKKPMVGPGYVIKDAESGKGRFDFLLQKCAEYVSTEAPVWTPFDADCQTFSAFVVRQATGHHFDRLQSKFRIAMNSLRLGADRLLKTTQGRRSFGISFQNAKVAPLPNSASKKP